MLSIPHRAGKLSGYSVAYCTLLIFSDLFVCGFWSCEKRSTSLWRWEQTPVQPRLASGSLSFTSLLCSGLPTPSHHRLSAKPRNPACLMLHLLLIIREAVQLYCVQKMPSCWANVIILVYPRPPSASGSKTAFLMIFLLVSISCYAYSVNAA